jgi:hypothetical protein
MRFYYIETKSSPRWVRGVGAFAPAPLQTGYKRFGYQKIYRLDSTNANPPQALFPYGGTTITQGSYAANHVGMRTGINSLETTEVPQFGPRLRYHVPPVPFLHIAHKQKTKTTHAQPVTGVVIPYPKVTLKWGKEC